jgi:phosphoribosyl-AMP cyclohydrolase
MKLSEQTLDILKNYSTINSNFYCGGGKTLRTISIMKNILAEASIDEDLPEFGLYDLSEFLSTVSLYDKPNLDFEDTHVTITNGAGTNVQTKYYFASKDILTVADKDVTLPDGEVNFSLTKEILNKILKAGSVLQVSDIILKCDGDSVKLGVFDKNNPTSNSHMITLEDMDTSVEYEFYFKIENLKMISDNYEVSISSGGAAHFTSDKVEYWIALEAESNYGR